MPLAFETSMTRWALLAAGVGVAAAVLAFARSGGGPAVASGGHQRIAEAAVALPAPTRESVNVVYELVVVNPPSTAPVKRSQTASSRPRPASVSRPPRAHAVSASNRPTAGLVGRAGRMLVGDGRYRPEPFPRPDAGR